MEEKVRWPGCELRRLKQLEEEKQQLKQLVADLSLDKQMLQDVLKKTFEARAAPARGSTLNRRLPHLGPAGLPGHRLATGQLVLQSAWSGRYFVTPAPARAGPSAYPLRLSAPAHLVAAGRLAG